MINVKRTILYGFMVISACCDSFASLDYPLPMSFDHPVLEMERKLFSSPSIAANEWKCGLGRYGETYVTNVLELRGYQVIEPKLARNNGFDRIAIKKINNKIVDIKIIEVKSGNSTLQKTKLMGKQGSAEWLKQNLNNLKNAPNLEYRQLAEQIEAFCTKNKKNLLNIFEIWQVKPESDSFTCVNGNGQVMDRGVISRRLKKIAKKTSKAGWAKDHLQKLTAIMNTKCRDYVARTTQTRVGNSLRALNTYQNNGLAKSKMAVTQKTNMGNSFKSCLRIRNMCRAVTIAVICYELYSIHQDVLLYSNGKCTMRSLIANTTARVSGMGGAIVGGYGGAKLGGTIGLFIGGPVGGLVGGAVGGIVGSIVGCGVFEYADRAFVSFWYDSYDSSVHELVEDQMTDWIVSSKMCPEI